MTTYPILYEKENFIEFLEKNNVNEKTIKKFNKLPETIIKNKSEYKLNIMVAYNSGGETSYSFELNYYSKDLMEFLFNYKIFNDFEDSVNYLVCELIKHKYIKKEKWASC